MVFKPIGLVYGLVIIKNWSNIGSRLTGLLTEDRNQEQLSIFSLVWGLRFAKYSLVKGRTFANPAVHPYPNYMEEYPPGYVMFSDNQG